MRVIWYSCPSGRKYEGVRVRPRRDGGQQAVDQKRKSAGRGQRREQAQHQQHTGHELAAGAHVGEDVGVLVADVGQRVPEPGHSRAAPPAEQLLQPVGAEHHAQPDPQHQQTQMLGAAPPDVVQPVVVLVVVDVGGRRRRVPGGRMRLDVRQRLLVFEQVVTRGPGAGHRRGGAVGDDGGGSRGRVEVTGVADWGQIVFGVDQARRGGASRGRLRGFAGPLPICVIRLTGHGCQGKGSWPRIGDLSGAFARQSAVCPPKTPGSVRNRPASPPGGTGRHDLGPSGPG